ncbi:PIN domain-containing protein [Salegentibacter mishustinae]|uniref:PIN domain-containing protein n=1 Tax=Salegentibacter mishustinae TaxID=270918 RepID=UPI0024938D18|nr:PIN domain-containing protein [Salegentibacter mishustinae]
MAIKLFIDTNIYLNFYHYSKDDLDQLNKLIVLIDNDHLELFLPRQILDEFYRNRENKIADALKRLNQSKIDTQFPQFCKDFEEYHSLKKIIKNFNKEKQALQDKVMKEIESQSLEADNLTANLFRKAQFLETTEEIIHKAKLRFDLGNPPGKNKSYGDAVNWETLLYYVQGTEDFYFIADDKDYNSEIDRSKFNSFLSNEWYQQKKSEIHYFNSLTDFFKEVFPDIKLAIELEKEILISSLINSGSFYDTRKAINKLDKIKDYSREQVNDVISASLNNTQIYWISDDTDINEFLYQFVISNKEKVDKNLLEEFFSKIPNKTIPPPPPIRV